MATIEERVAGIEVRVDEHAQAFVDLRTDLRRFEERVDRRFETVDARFVQVDARFDALDQKMSTHFRWIVGMLLATLVSIVGALVGQ